MFVQIGPCKFLWEIKIKTDFLSQGKDVVRHGYSMICREDDTRKTIFYWYNGFILCVPPCPKICLIHMKWPSYYRMVINTNKIIVDK